MANNFEATKSAPTPENSSVNNAKGRIVSINIKTAIIFAAIIIVGALAFYFKGVFIAATVNGSPISRIALMQELEKTAGKNMLKSLIVQKLIGEEARKKGITIGQGEVDETIKGIEEQIASQGQTLTQALAAQGIKMEDFKKQVIIQKELEKLIADKTSVTDEEVNQYIKDNKIEIPKGEEVGYKSQIKSQLSQQKISEESKSYIDSLLSKAKINYFVSY